MGVVETWTSVEVESTGRLALDTEPLPAWVRRDGSPGPMFRPERIQMVTQRDADGSVLSRRVRLYGSLLKADGTPGKRPAYCPLYTLVSPPVPAWVEQWIADHEHIGGA